MKKIYKSTILASFLILMLSACRSQTMVEKKAISYGAPSQQINIQNTGKIEKNIKGSFKNIQKKKPKSTLKETIKYADKIPEVQKIRMKIDGQSFTITLYENSTTKAFINQLPMTLHMEEMNGNEKFYYMDEELPTASENVKNIQVGDIMLFGSDCLVLFFKSFDTSYRYTPIGRVEDTKKFVKALTSGTVEVSFYLE